MPYLIVNLLYLIPSKSDTSNPGTYSIKSRTSFNEQPIQMVSTVRDLGLLNTRFRAGDNVARATKKAHGMLVYLKRSFATQTHSIWILLFLILLLDKCPLQKLKKKHLQK